MPDSPDPESLLARLRATRERIASKLEEAREQGLDLEPLLKDCDRMRALLEGEGEPGFDVQTFVARVEASMEEIEQAAHLRQQAEAIGDLMGLPAMIEQLEQRAAEMRKQSSRAEQSQTAAEIEEQLAAARRQLEQGELPVDEMENVNLTLVARMAEIKRRMLFRSAAASLYWEKQTPEWWAQRSPEQRASMEGLVARWRESREEILGELPLEDRRRLEAMTLEDFDRPGACDP
jgi:hypothetical protein